MLGEYGTWRRTPDTNTGNPKDMPMHKRSVNYWLTYSTKTMRANGLLPFWWEVGQALDRKIIWLRTSGCKMPLLQDISKK
ncbi:MAG: hypothetical protein M3O71_03075 [Bacteroidota bacterium]|nr:hypothetical protein [Bacteroidota bacterium]